MDKLKIDFWYGDSFKDIVSAGCFFCPGGYYRGNVYNKDGKAIGDYTETGKNKQ